MFLESMADSKVLALVLSPLEKFYRWTTIGNEPIVVLKEHIEKFKINCSRLGRPIFTIDETENIANRITDYLSE